MKYRAEETRDAHLLFRGKPLLPSLLGWISSCIFFCFFPSTPATRTYAFVYSHQTLRCLLERCLPGDSYIVAPLTLCLPACLSSASCCRMPLMAEAQYSTSEHQSVSHLLSYLMVSFALFSTENYEAPD